MSWTVLVQSNGSYTALSPVVHGDFVLSINTIQNNDHLKPEGTHRVQTSIKAA